MPPGGANIAIFVASTDVGDIPRYRRYGLRFFELKIGAVIAVGCLGGRRARGTYVRALPSNFFDRKEGQFFLQILERPPPPMPRMRLGGQRLASFGKFLVLHSEFRGSSYPNK